MRAAGGLIVLHPFRVDELRDSADGLLRLVGGDTGQVDGDAVVAVSRPADLRLADPERVDALGDHGDRPLLHVGAGLVGWKVGQLVIDVGPTRKVQAFVDEELPTPEVRRQPGHVTRQGIVVGDPIEVAGPVDEDGEHQDRHHDQADGPAED